MLCLRLHVHVCTCTGYSVPAILSSLLGSDLWTEAEAGYRVVLIINPCARRITNLTRRWDKLKLIGNIARVSLYVDIVD